MSAHIVQKRVRTLAGCRKTFSLIPGPAEGRSPESNFYMDSEPAASRRPGMSAKNL
jgi:hypothetical protein